MVQQTRDAEPVRLRWWQSWVSRYLEVEGGHWLVTRSIDSFSVWSSIVWDFARDIFYEPMFMRHV